VCEIKLLMPPYLGKHKHTAITEAFLEGKLSQCSMWLILKWSDLLHLENLFEGLEKLLTNS